MRVTERTLRAQAAIVGVADIASPTGRARPARPRARGRDDPRRARRRRPHDRRRRRHRARAACRPASPSTSGSQPRYLDGTMVGGSSYELHVEHAAAAIAAGLCEVVVGVYAATPRGDRTPRQRRAASAGMPGPNPMLEWEMPYGLRMPMGAYALAASRHMAQYGTTSEQLAQIAVDTRRWAAMNPNARYRDPITIDDVLASPMQVSPLHLLDCCLVTDGAGAFVMTSAERARDLAEAAGLRARRGDVRHALDDQRDARPHDDGRRGVRSGRVRDGRHQAGRRRPADGLRLVHDHRAAAPRGPRLLREGRGRRVRRGRQARARAGRCR